MNHLKTRGLHVLSFLCTLMLAAAVVRADVSTLFNGDRLTSSLVDCVAQDKYGFLWVGTEYGLNKFDGYRFAAYLNSPSDTTTLSDNEIVRLLSDREGRLWVGTNLGLSRYDYERDCFVRYPFPGHLTPRVNALRQHSNGDILIGTAGYGLFSIRKGEDCIVADTGMTRRPMDVYYSRIYEDEQHYLWRSSHVDTLTRIRMVGHEAVDVQDFMSPFGPAMDFLPADSHGLLVVCLHGILRFDYATGQLSDAGYDLSVLQGKVSMRRAVLVPNGDIFIGTSGSGLMVIPHGTSKLVAVDNANGDFSLGTSDVNDILMDKDRNLWVCCYKKGLLQLNQGDDVFSMWSFSRQHFAVGSSVSSAVVADDGTVYCVVQKSGVFHIDRQGRILSRLSSPAGPNLLYRDRQGRYWLCTENTVYSYRPETGAAQPLATFGGWGLNCMTDDGNGTLYLCVFGKGMAAVDVQTGKVVSYDMNHEDPLLGRLCNDWVKALFADSHGLVWIGTSNGLCCFNPKSRSFRSLGWDLQLPGVQVTAFNETPRGDILIGTQKGLFLYDRRQNRVAPFEHAEPLDNKLVYGILFDRDGDLWLSTSMGIWQYDRSEKHFISHVHGNGLKTKEYVLGAMFQRADGLVGFGTDDGLTTFFPEAVKRQNLEMGDVWLTRFVVGGKAENPFREHFTVPYSENTFSLDFSLLTYKNAENITFQYRINGQRAWISLPEGQNTIVFNKMKPGTYGIEVRAMANGLYSKNTRKLTVEVRGPWYASTLAWLCYALLACGAVVAVVYTIEHRRRNEMEEQKMRFLINATHDIRSPLTLIMGPLKKLSARVDGFAGMAADDNARLDERTVAEMRTDIDTIDRNAQRLLLLVNQILDERKIDKDQMKLHCRETDLVAFVNGVCALYQYNARQRNIQFRFSHPENGKVMAWIDRIHFDKVVSNLLSNAFKYTFDGGQVDVILSVPAEAGGKIVLQVIDNGIGLNESNPDRLFDRFYQGSNQRDLHLDGTGIGLNLSRAIVNMHGGRIAAANRDDGTRGTVLTVWLPQGNAHLKPEEIDNGQQPPQEPATRRQPSRNFRILIADDDAEIAAYIRSELGQWYRFDAAANGKEALKALLTGNYDLVVSDVMMPEMDGISLLKEIKGNSRISDIPVILLTSKSQVGERLEGLKHGADAFLSKPFNMEELHILIDNLVDNVRRLRGKFSGMQQQEKKVENVEVKGNNDALMERIMNCVNKNLSDPDFNVEKLSEIVGISRAQLHRKMKEITGISTSDFIRNLRLEQAARLIKERKINVTQVAYAVGFNSQNHFSTVFKKHYGMTPTEFSEREKKAKAVQDAEDKSPKAADGQEEKEN